MVSPDLKQYWQENATETTIGFVDFIDQTFPQVAGTPITGYVDKILKTVKPFCRENDQGTFAKIRGGTMRRFIFHTADIQDGLDRAMLNVPKEYLGESNLTEAVIDHAFGVHDLDIALIRKKNTDPENNQVIINSIVVSLIDLGFSQNDGAEINLTNGSYQVRIKPIMIGKNKSLSLFKIDFYLNGQKKPVFKLDLSDIALTDQQKRDDFRLFDQASTVDLDSIADLREKNSQLIVNYQQYLEIQAAELNLQSHYLFSKIPLVHPGFSFTQLVSQGFRDVGNRALDISTLFLDYPNLTLADLKNFFNPDPWDGRFNKNISQWIASQSEEIQERQVALLSDIMYGYFANVFMALALSYLDTALFTIPLGRIINNWETLTAVMQKMAEKFYEDNSQTLLNLSMFYKAKNCGFHSELSGPILLLDALIDLGLLPKDTQRTISSAIKLLFDPMQLLPASSPASSPASAGKPTGKSTGMTCS